MFGDYFLPGSPIPQNLLKKPLQLGAVISLVFLGHGFLAMKVLAPAV